MLGILLIYSIGKYFYALAVEYGRQKWVFAVIGVACFYAGIIIGGVIIGAIAGLFDLQALLNAGDFLLGLLCIPFGLLSCWGLYTILLRSWSKVQLRNDPDILDSDLT